jgi:hypothetical protein
VFIQSILSIIGSIFFIITPTATFILVDAVSYQDKALSWNSGLYIFGGFTYFFGAIANFLFLFSATSEHALNLGAAFFLLGSLIYVLAVGWGIYRACILRDKSQISLVSFMIESWVSGLYLVGSFIFVVGSILSFPSLYTPHVYAIFLSGTFFFIVGSVSGLCGQLWRYVQNEIKRERLVRYKKAVMESIKRSTLKLQEVFVNSRPNTAPGRLRMTRTLSFTKKPSSSVKVTKTNKLKPHQRAVVALPWKQQQAQNEIKRESILRYRKAVMESIKRSTFKLQEALVKRPNSALGRRRGSRKLFFTKKPSTSVKVTKTKLKPHQIAVVAQVAPWKQQQQQVSEGDKDEDTEADSGSRDASV